MLEYYTHGISGLPAISEGGHDRVMGCLKDPGWERRCQAYRESFPVMPRSKWYEVDYTDLVTDIFDQNGRSSCVGESGVAALMLARAISGMERHILSPWFSYSQINGGRDAGAIVADCLESLKDKGTCLDSSVPYGTYRSNQISQAAYTEAKRFRIDLGYGCDSFDELVSGLLNNRVPVFGIDCGRNFRPDGNGFLPNQSGAGGGHGLYACGLKFASGMWWLKIPNSWSPQWGVNGFCYMNESYFSGAYGNYVITAASEDPQDPTTPPVAV